MRSPVCSFVLVCLVAASGCGDNDALVPLEDDPGLLAMVAGADGLEEGVQPRIGALQGGEPVRYWDLGRAVTAEVMPLYRLCRPQAGACDPIDHPPIVDLLPGEDGYSRYGRLHEVAVTDAWDGAPIGSVEALRRAVRSGRLDEPRETVMYVHLPIVGPGIELEVDDGRTQAPTPVHVRGMVARGFDFSRTQRTPFLESDRAFVRNVYVLTRDGDSGPLHEGLRGEDLNGDGDRVDTNSLFGVGLTDPDYTPLWAMVEVTVPADTRGIDDAPESPELSDAEQLFEIDRATYEITARPDEVVEYAVTDVLIDCPLQSAPGQL